MKTTIFAPCTTCIKTAALPSTNVSVEEPEDEEVDFMTYWIMRFEDEMFTAPNAAASILSYFLEIKVGHPCTIFCPLDYGPYFELGKKMAESNAVLDAAKRAGLLAAGIQHYVSAALSNDDCWNGMASGVAYLVNDPELRVFIPYRSRCLAERILSMNYAIKEGEVEWWQVYDFYESQFGKEMHGY